MTERVDHWGALASAVCAIHCALNGLIPAMFGVLGLGFLLSDEAEWALTLLAIGLASYALYAGYRRHHSLLVAEGFGLGMLGLLAARFLEAGHEHEVLATVAAHSHEGANGPDLGIWVTIGSGFVLVLAHFANQRAFRARKSTRAPESCCEV